jgi:hypothetical protein
MTRNAIVKMSLHLKSSFYNPLFDIVPTPTPVLEWARHYFTAYQTKVTTTLRNERDRD